MAELSENRARRGGVLPNSGQGLSLSIMSFLSAAQVDHSAAVSLPKRHGCSQCSFVVPWFAAGCCRGGRYHGNSSLGQRSSGGPPGLVRCPTPSAADGRAFSVGDLYDRALAKVQTIYKLLLEQVPQSRSYGVFSCCVKSSTVPPINHLHLGILGRLDFKWYKSQHAFNAPWAVCQIVNSTTWLRRK